MAGNPYSGNTFVSGLYSIAPFATFHEGIMQTITGFTPNNNYTINLHQSVVKQINSLDQSGSWAVYIDNNLAGITFPTFSNLPFSSNSLIWESRDIVFTATAISHTIKFLPYDDDLDLLISTTNINGALRMGIDSIFIVNCKLPIIDIGNDTTLCQNETLTVDASTLNANYLWQDNSTNPTLNITQQGTYWVQVTNSCGSTTDTIEVNYSLLPIINLGNDTTLCEGETLTLNASTLNASYFWQDNSTNPILDITQQGSYWAEITVNNCIATDTILVNYNPLPIINLGNDTTLCQDKILTFDASIPNATYIWQDNSNNSIFNITQQGIYWVKVTVNNCSIRDTIIIEIEECEIILEIPNVFTPNNDHLNDLFIPIISKGIVSMHTTIYNRWGNKVFETNNLLIEWDGQNVSGGTYFWNVNYIDVNGVENSLKSYVTILK